MTKEQVEAQYESAKRAGYIQDFSVNRVATEHDNKTRWGKIVDWVKWKTPLRRWSRKPRPVPMHLSDFIERRVEVIGLPEGMTDEQYEALIRWAEPIVVYELHYPQDPYQVIEADVSVVPKHPVSFIKMTYKLGGDDAEAGPTKEED